ncbi:MAG: CvpA family protein [Clostridia bacterium]|nr:CvpA family protein [Clostridia bacterium]
MGASTIIDIVLCSFAVLIILKFTIKGFVCSLLDLTKAILSLALAFILRIPVANLFNGWFMENAMVSLVEKSLSAFLKNDPTNIAIDVKTLQDKAPEFFEKFLTHFGLDFDKFIVEFDAFFNQNDSTVIDSLAENIGGAIATLLSTIIAFVAITIVAYITLSIVFALLSHLKNFEGVKTADRLLGLTLGVIIAIVVTWGLTQGILFVVEFIGPSFPDYINDGLIENSMVVSIFKNLNLIEFIKNKIYA